MAALTLYHAAPSRSSIVLWMLEELGEPFDLRVLDLKKGESRQPDYLAINPMGKVPALVHDGTVVTEVAAICCYLADAFPQAEINIPIGHPQRGPYLKWLFFCPGAIEPAMMDRAFKRAEEAPRAALGYGDFATTMDVVARAVTPGPFLLGNRFTAADVVVGSSLRWGMAFRLIPERAEFLDYVSRFVDRPAARRAAARDDALAKASAE